MTGYWHTRENSYEDMMMALVKKGPLAVSVDAGGWHDYSGGIFDGGNTRESEFGPHKPHLLDTAWRTAWITGESEIHGHRCGEREVSFESSDTILNVVMLHLVVWI